MARLQVQGAPPPPACQAPLWPPLLTFGISSLGTVWRVVLGVGVVAQVHPGQGGLRSQHLTDSHQIPMGPSPPCPQLLGILDLRSWEPQDLAALEGSVCFGNSLEALLHLSQTQRTQSVTHARTKLTTDGYIRLQNGHRQPMVGEQCRCHPDADLTYSADREESHLSHLQTGLMTHRDTMTL